MWVAHPQMCRAGGHITLLWVKLQAGEATHNNSLTCSHVSQSTWEQKERIIKMQPSCVQGSPYICTSVCRLSWVCVIEHMCVYHDASPQLSHSFPAASRGWKRVKPQTSGAPQPIRIVYLASHGRLTEQQHTASHISLQGKPLLFCFPSFSIFFKLHWLHLLSFFSPLFSQMQFLHHVPEVIRWW